MSKRKDLETLTNALFKLAELEGDLPKEKRKIVHKYVHDRIASIEFPEKLDVEVKNWKLPVIPNPPKEIKIKKPKWYSPFNYKVLDTLIINIQKIFKGELSDALDRHTKKENALAVRLVTQDLKSFYNAIAAATSTSPPSFQNDSGTAVRAAVDSSNRVRIISEGGLSGAATDGSTQLTAANTWVQVPTSIPTSDYFIVVTKENEAGTIRWSFSNGGVPSTTNGNKMVNDEIVLNLAANQAVYFGSTDAGDDINWTTKII